MLALAILVTVTAWFDYPNMRRDITLARSRRIMRHELKKVQRG